MRPVTEDPRPDTGATRRSDVVSLLVALGIATALGWQVSAPLAAVALAVWIAVPKWLAPAMFVACFAPSAERQSRHDDRELIRGGWWQLGRAVVGVHSLLLVALVVARPGDGEIPLTLTLLFVQLLTLGGWVVLGLVQWALVGSHHAGAWLAGTIALTAILVLSYRLILAGVGNC